MTPEQIQKQILDLISKLYSNISVSKERTKELMEEIIEDCESRIECL